ncbi:hypothetical protein D3C81_2021250 [compost metagenome]
MLDSLVGDTELFSYVVKAAGADNGIEDAAVRLGADQCVHHGQGGAVFQCVFVQCVEFLVHRLLSSV